MLKHVTRVDNRRRIDRDVSFVDVLNDAFFIDYEGGTVSETLLFVEDAVVFDDSTFEITEDRECNADLFCEYAVGGNTVNTHTENLRFGRFELGDISLIRLQFLRSTTGERQYVDRKYDVFLTFEIAQLVGLAVGGAESEIGRLVPDLQMCFGWSWLLGQCNNTEHSKQHKGCK